MEAYTGDGYRVLYRVEAETVAEQPTPAFPIRAGADALRHFTNLQRLGLIPTDREAFCVLLVNARHRTIGFHVVSIGSLNSTSVHPREVFRAAVTIGASALIAVHNHPSGDAAPSPEDARVTTRLTEVGQLLGIELLDHLVVGADRYYTFADGRHWEIPGQGGS